MDTPSAGALSRVDRKPLYEQLVKQLRAYVTEAKLSAGDRLPPERELAERLGVSRASVRQALVALEVQGVVETRHGEGTFLRDDHIRSLSLARLAELKRKLPDLLDARDAIEVKLAELAAERRTATDLEAMDAALERMAQAIEAGSTGEAGDREFHQCIVRAARSEVLAQMYALLADDIELSSHETIDQIGTPSALLEEIRAVAEAVRERDTQGAATAMRVHLATVRELKLRAWSPVPD